MNPTGHGIIDNLVLVLLLMGGFFAVLVLYLVLFQSRMIYFPQKGGTLTPGSIGLAFERITVITDDNIELNCWYIPAENPMGTLLFCHGNGGNISHRLESISIFNHLGISVFIFDYRGYGLSKGKPNEQGTYSDAEAAWKYLVEKRQIEPSEIILFGRSLGGAVAAYLASKYNPRSLIVESCFTDIRDLGQQLYPYLPVRLLSRYRYNTVEYLEKVKCPVLIIHSRDDDMIPLSHGEKLFESANSPKEFLEIHGKHNDSFIVSGKLYEDGLANFLRKYID